MLTPIVQNDERLKAEPSIEPYGCLFRVIGEICETAAEKTLPPEQILEAYRWCRDHSYLLDEHGNQAWVKDHTEVGRAHQYYLDVPKTFRYVYRQDYGDDQSGSFGDRSEANHFAIYARIKGYRIGHFIHASRDKLRLWDPYWPAGEIVEVLSLRGYRV